MTEAEQLIKAREELDWTQAQMGRALDLDRSYLSQLEKGRREIQPWVMRKLEAVLQEERHKKQFLQAMKEMPQKTMHYRFDRTAQMVPVVSLASAGLGGNYSDLAGQYDEYVSTDCPDRNAYALVVDGHSMEPRFRHGDRVVVAPNSEPKNGNAVIARHAETGRVYFKMFTVFGLNREMVRLASLNPQYPTEEFRREEFRFIQPVYGLGGRKFED